MRNDDGHEIVFIQKWPFLFKKNLCQKGILALLYQGLLLEKN
jgi:hypothetical protein